MSGCSRQRPTALCGCWYPIQGHWNAEKAYLPQIGLQSQTTILASTSRTILTQTFINKNTQKLEEVQYTFPLYDGVSVVGFRCSVAGRTIFGVVKEKKQARTDYNDAIARGETAGLLEQLPEASDVFTTKVGNVPANEKVIVEIVYLGELKHHAETDGSSFTIPTIIAPRYRSTSAESVNARHNAVDTPGISICIDIAVDQGCVIKGVQSPSHPIAVTMGRTSKMQEDAFDNSHASATLALGSTELEKDFIIVILAKGQDNPRALLEEHPTIPGQRAIMTTLVPRFSLPSIHPEIVFVVDRSGSMDGKIGMLVAAMNVFLKSLPVGVKFNICSFGSSYDYLFKKSKTYDQSSLQEALKHLSSFSADYGGTEMLEPIKATVERRYKDMHLEIMVITDGGIWNQDELFSFITESARENPIRFFSLGIGDGASSSLVEGIARAGNGFAQFVGENEKMDKRVVRMLKGALSPHIKDYTIEVVYDESHASDDFELIHSVGHGQKIFVADLKKPSLEMPQQKPISLFDTCVEEEVTKDHAGRYDHLPQIDIPNVLQAPHQIPQLYLFNRTSVFLLLGPESTQATPKAIKLRATSGYGPLELKIPVQDIGIGQTLHQLAAKKAVHELEQGRGWLTNAVDTNSGKLLKDQNPGRWDEIVEREAVRLGITYQVSGKWCSFVALDENSQKLASEPAQSRQSMDGGAAPGAVSRSRGDVGHKKKAVKMLSIPSSSMQSQMLGSCSPPAYVAPQLDMEHELNITQLQQPRSVVCDMGQPQSAARAPSSGLLTSMKPKSLGGGSLFGTSRWQGSIMYKRRASPSPALSSRDRKSQMPQPDLLGEYACSSMLADTSTVEKCMHSLIALQKFDGSWELSSQLLGLIGLSKNQLPTGTSDAIKATIAAIAFLEAKLMDEKDVWEMVAEKALGWLRNADSKGNVAAEIEKMKLAFAV